MHLQWLEQEQMDEWDQFQLACPRGHYSQLSTWLRSFRQYGGTERILGARDENGRTIGGLGCVVWRKLGIEFWVAPAGPVVEAGAEEHATAILEMAAEAARQHGAMALLYQPATAQSGSLEEFLLPLACLPTSRAVTMKQKVPGMAVGQMMWIDFSRADSGSNWEKDLLATFSQNTRRDIRAGLRSQLSCFEAQDPREIRAVYEVIEANGRAQGYATRTWQEFGETLVDQIRRRQAILLGIRYVKELLGAHYGVLAGRRYSYIMGGTIRTEGSLRVGHFAHWMAITKAHQLGLRGYDFTSGGSPGVNRFKMGFRPEIVKLVPTQELVFQRWRYHAWVKVLPTMQRHSRGLVTVAKRIDLSGRKSR